MNQADYIHAYKEMYASIRVLLDELIADQLFDDITDAYKVGELNDDWERKISLTVKMQFDLNSDFDDFCNSLDLNKVAAFIGIEKKLLEAKNSTDNRNLHLSCLLYVYFNLSSYAAALEDQRAIGFNVLTKRDVDADSLSKLLIKVSKKEKLWYVFTLLQQKEILLAVLSLLKSTNNINVNIKILSKFYNYFNNAKKRIVKEIENDKLIAQIENISNQCIELKTEFLDCLYSKKNEKKYLDEISQKFCFIDTSDLSENAIKESIEGNSDNLHFTEINSLAKKATEHRIANFNNRKKYQPLIDDQNWLVNTLINNLSHNYINKLYEMYIIGFILNIYSMYLYIKHSIRIRSIDMNNPNKSISKTFASQIQTSNIHYGRRAKFKLYMNCYLMQQMIKEDSKSIIIKQLKNLAGSHTYCAFIEYLFVLSSIPIIIMGHLSLSCFNLFKFFFKSIYNSIGFSSNITISTIKCFQNIISIFFNILLIPFLFLINLNLETFWFINDVISKKKWYASIMFSLSFYAVFLSVGLYIGLTVAVLPLVYVLPYTTAILISSFLFLEMVLSSVTHKFINFVFKIREHTEHEEEEIELPLKVTTEEILELRRRFYTPSQRGTQLISQQVESDLESIQSVNDNDVRTSRTGLGLIV